MLFVCVCLGSVGKTLKTSSTVLSRNAYMSVTVIQKALRFMSTHMYIFNITGQGIEYNSLHQYSQILFFSCL